MTTLDPHDWHVFRDGKWEQLGSFVPTLIKIDGGSVSLSNLLVEEFIPNRSRHERYIPVPEDLIDRTTVRVFSHTLQYSVPVGVH